MAKSEASKVDQPWTGKLADGTVITKQDLKKFLVEHELWLKSEGKTGKRLELIHANLSGVNIPFVNISKAILSYCDLSKANLCWVNLSGALLMNSNLEGAGLIESNLSYANIGWANISKGILVAANMLNTNLEYSNLSYSDLSCASIDGAKLANTNLYGCVYESVSGLPAKGWLWGLRGVDTIVYYTKYGQSGLVLLRDTLKEAGLRETEREATYAIEAGKLAHMSWNDPANWFEKIFLTVFFLWPCGFGLYPGRPLQILAGLIPLFAVFYGLAICRPHGEGGIYRMWQDGRLPKYIGTKEPERLHATGFAAVRWALYFSILSACRIGWRELNPGSWIVNMQRREYLLKPTDWVRTVSGIQALTSVYLLALAVLTYFGRPFG